jgi:hypothetical protein
VDQLVERVDGRNRVLGVVSRREAIREGWLHRVAVTVCRDERGTVAGPDITADATGLTLFATVRCADEPG